MSASTEAVPTSQEAPVYHLPGLNGLRAICALAVVISHTILRFSDFGLNPFVFGRNRDGSPTSTALAGFGVSVFFALSGFLITHLLLLERHQTGRVGVRDFYFRRALRIWPLYYAYLAIAVAVGAGLAREFSARLFLLYVFLLPNVPYAAGKTLPYVAHYWSLGVEEQFYLAWPWIVRQGHALRSWCVAAIVFLIALKTLLRFGAGDSSTSYLLLHTTRYHCILIGALGAILLSEQSAIFLRLASHRLTQLIAWAVIGLAAVNRFHVASFLDNELVSVVGVALIAGQIVPKRPLVNLDTRLFDFIGQISYGIYVIHPLVIIAVAPLLRNHIAEYPLVKYALAFTSVLAATLGVAYLSYVFFERRFLVMKKAYSAVISSSTRASAAGATETGRVLPPVSTALIFRSIAWFTSRLSGIPGVSRIAEQARSRYQRKSPHPLVRRVLGIELELHPADYVDGVLMFYPRGYESREISFLLDTLRAGDSFLDIGAHLGLYSLLAAKRVGTGGRVVAFEADPVTFSRLRSNVDRNNAENVTAIEIGVSDSTASLRLGRYPGNSGGSTLLSAPGTTDGPEVRCAPLLDLLLAQSIVSIAAAKLDLEGLEYRVLYRFLSDAPLNLRPRRMVVENIGKRRDAAGGDPVELLLSYGYRVVERTAENTLLESISASPRP